MKKYLFLSLICILFAIGFAYIYFNTQGSLAAKNEKILAIMSTVEQTELELDKDALRLRDFLILDYDAVTRQALVLENFCKTQKISELDSASQEISVLFSDYCNLIEKKILALEDFKSLNSIYKNSLYYLHDLTIKSASRKWISLTYPVISYTLFSDDLSKKISLKKIRDLDKSTPNDRVIISHADKLLNLQEKRRLVLSQIIDSPSIKVFRQIKNTYLQTFEAERKSTNLYQRLLLAFCFILLILFFMNVLKIWQSSAQLVEVNATLEQRVLERTQALKESQKIVTEQQESIAARSKLSALGEMAGGVAHEINTPLAVIQLRTNQLIEAMSEDIIDKELFDRALYAIDQTVTRIAKIVNGLRAFARDGKNDPMAVYLVSDIIQDTLGLCSERFANNGIKLEYVCLKEAEINCRPTEISQVLLNLLNNAFDAVENEPEKWVRIETTEVQEKIQVSVCDSGKGIPVEIQEKIMQPFFTTKEIGKGTGLGLSISRGIVQSHGGSLQIDNSVKNTKFILTFPKLG